MSCRRRRLYGGIRLDEDEPAVIYSPPPPKVTERKTNTFLGDVPISTSTRTKMTKKVLGQLTQQDIIDILNAVLK